MILKNTASNKTYILLILFLIVCKSYGQEEIPKYILASKYFHEANSMGVVVRFDNGIDSIHFPIDANKIQINLEKLNIEGSESGEHVFYKYEFTSKINGTYKLPDGVIWSHNKSYNMIFNDSVFLSIPRSIVKISEEDSINVEIESQRRLKKADKERAEITIKSRISELQIFKKGILWTDYEKYKIDDEIRIIVEIRSDFDIDNLKRNFNKSQSKLKILRSYYNHVIDDKNEIYYAVFICNALDTGLIKIPQFKMKAEKKELQINSLQFMVIGN